MKKTQFRIGLLTACLLSVTSVASAQSCGTASSDSKACKCSRKNCDDTGLLEVINNAASSAEARLASLLPVLGKPSASQKCGCSKCSPQSDFAIHYTESVSPLHMATPEAQPDIVVPPAPRNTTPAHTFHDPVPVPPPGAPELVPLPDSRNDPFKDESTRIPRPVPTRPAGYLRSNGNSQIKLDPQASHPKSMRSILMSQAASKSISDSADGLATTTSTRRAASLGESQRTPIAHAAFKQTDSEVVPASLATPVSDMQGPTAPRPAADLFINPLRAH